MKTSSMLVSIILFIAVVILYYLHFSNRNCTANATGGGSDSTKTSTAMTASMPKEIKASKIVYVNADSLFAQYEYVKALKKETEAKQSRFEVNYQSKAKKLQEDYAELQQKAQQGLLSQEQGKAAEDDMKRRKGELDLMEKQLTDLAEETQKKNIAVQEHIAEYLKEYNKNSHYSFILAYTSAAGSVLLANDSLDITKEIVDGLNVQYKKDGPLKTPAKK